MKWLVVCLGKYAMDSYYIVKAESKDEVIERLAKYIASKTDVSVDAVKQSIRPKDVNIFKIEGEDDVIFVGSIGEKQT